ncbi:MAG: HigA family addiction module antitoxin [Methylococcales bacterium]
MCKVPYPHPGEILMEEFLKPMDITQYRLAKEIGVPERLVGEIVAGIRGITADTGLRLSRFFGMSEGFWIGLQMDYDAALAKQALAKTLAKIKPWNHDKNNGSEVPQQSTPTGTRTSRR